MPGLFGTLVRCHHGGLSTMRTRLSSLPSESVFFTEPPWQISVIPDALLCSANPVEGTCGSLSRVRSDPPAPSSKKEEHHEEKSQRGVDRAVGDRIICQRDRPRAAAQ